MSKNIRNNTSKSTDVTDEIVKSRRTHDFESLHVYNENFEKVITSGHTTTLNATISDLNDSSNTNWIMPATAATFSVVSTSIQDAAGGTGMTIIIIVGLDQDFNEISEVIALTGTTPVFSQLTYRALNISVGLASGSGLSAAGTISISSSADAQCFGSYIIGDTTCEVGRYTVKKGYKFLGTSILISGGKNVDATFKLSIALPGRMEISTGELYPSQGISFFPNTTAIFLNEGETFKGRAFYNSGGSGVRYMSVIINGVIGPIDAWTALLTV